MYERDKKIDRRDFMKKSVLASAGAAVGLSMEERVLLANEAESKKTVVAEKDPVQTGSVGELPIGKIGNVNISRLICGGNLINGFAHSRDLTYVSDLLKHYFTDEKVMDTLELCEERGINTVIAHNHPNQNTVRVLNRYWNERGGKIQWLAQCCPKTDDVKTNIQIAIDNGAAGAFILGNIGDRWTREGRVDLLGKSVDFIKENGLIAGVGGHSLKTTMACEEAGLKTDFYMKTLHSNNYWSFGRSDEKKKVIDNYKHDNYWCTEPEKTIEFMKLLKKPWIAYKVLAAGGIHPTDGFKYAYQNGADFICAGIFDFQVREDVYVAKKILSGIKRERLWRG